MTVRSRLAALAAIAVALGAASCTDEDTGRCCKPVRASEQDKIPKPDKPDGSIPRDLIAQNAVFDCDQLTCASFQGSEAFCTRKCGELRPDGGGLQQVSAPCPSGFDCKPILESNPGPDADGGIRAITNADYFCVRKACVEKKDCPDGFDCDDIRHCVKTSHRCSAAK